MTARAAAPRARSDRRERQATRGFTLLEVLVAVAILGLALTVILSSQVGLFASATHAENLTVATNLARCRMNELDEKLLRDGYPLIDENDDGRCCDDDSDTEMRCGWKIERVELPEPSDPLDLLAGGGGDGGLGPAGGLGSVGKLYEIQQTKGASLGEGADLSSIGQELAASGGADALAQLAMGFAYPNLKPMLEASIRKVTVTVEWREGRTPRDLTVIQYLTNPMQGGFDPTTGDQLQNLADQLGDRIGGTAP